MFLRFFFLFILFIQYSAIYGQRHGRILADNTQFRKYSSTHCEAIGSLKEGDHCRIIGKGKEENIDGYGNNPWYKVRIGRREGFIYGALVEKIPNTSAEISVYKRGIINSDKVNIRNCGNVLCDELFQLGKGDRCKILSRTHYKDKLSLGTYPWYKIDYQGQIGYVFGALLSFPQNTPPANVAAIDSLRITSNDAKLFSKPNINSRVLQNLPKYRQFNIYQRSAKSTVIRPLGRHYWYKIQLKDDTEGWVYGGVTDKSEESVDCQCVDYVKNILEITGPTKHATDWAEVLLGGIRITQSGQDLRLDYNEIYVDFKPKDIVVFNKKHPQVNSQYGHIGVLEKRRKNAKGEQEVLIRGGNHPNKQNEYYTHYKCNNISTKWYRLTDEVRFFRLK